MTSADTQIFWWLDVVVHRFNVEVARQDEFCSRDTATRRVSMGIGERPLSLDDTLRLSFLVDKVQRMNRSQSLWALIRKYAVTAETESAVPRASPVRPCIPGLAKFRLGLRELG
ncbi:hypothetical protein J6590_076932 [Homalodisca vitripennis]|nr:hypothetical protein J6590_076932 [Homalodisca vitripennis]